MCLRINLDYPELFVRFKETNLPLIILSTFNRLLNFHFLTLRSIIPVMCVKLYMWKGSQ